MLKSLSISLFDLCRVPIISFNFCLFSLAAYPLAFRIEMTWTRVSCCLVYACINWFTCGLIPCVSFMVAEPESHFNASLRKGNKLVLDHGFSESVLSNCTADPMVHLYDSWMLPMLENSSRRVLNVVQMPVVGLGVLPWVDELVSSDGWAYTVVCLSLWVICRQWLFMSGL